jgi:hypothetical protein
MAPAVKQQPRQEMRFYVEQDMPNQRG